MSGRHPKTLRTLAGRALLVLTVPLLVLVFAADASGRPVGKAVGASSRASHGISMVTANVRYTMTDEHARTTVLRLLATSPDVVLLQEVGGRDLSHYVSAAPGRWTVWQPQGVKGESAIIWNADEFDAVRTGSTYGAALRGGRWLTWAVLHSQGTSLPVVTLHMPAKSTRRTSARADYQTMASNLAALVTRFDTSGPAPVVGGDWNQPLDRVKRSWGPVPLVRSLNLTTNWLGSPPCPDGSSILGGHIDGFAFDPAAVTLQDQGCLGRGFSDHRPVWVDVSY